MVDFGYIPNPHATERFVSDLRFPTGDKVPVFSLYNEPKDAFLWLGMAQFLPNYKRTFQTIGDCVSQGHSFACDILVGDGAARRRMMWLAENSSEAQYGLMRVECRGGKKGGYSDGWYGSGAVESLQKCGTLLRLDYSKETGNPEHDLRVYSGKKAKEWGNYGCGGANDQGLLDKIAVQFLVKEVTMITTIEQATAAIARGCPITICSGVGFETGDGRNGIMTMRDSTGVSRRRGSWAHCMCVAGLRWVNGAPQFRIFNSHGASAGGPDPGFQGPKGFSDCSWWCVAEDMLAILKQEDSFAVSDVTGFAKPPWDWENSIIV